MEVVPIPPCMTRCGLICSVVVPSRAMRSFTALSAPLPRAIIAITAPTPMMMPSIVSNDRSAFARSDAKATARISVRSMYWPGPSGPRNGLGEANGNQTWQAAYFVSDGVRRPVPLIVHPFVESPQLEPRADAGVHVLRDRMGVRGRKDGFARPLVGEVRLPAAPLPVRVQLAHEHRAARTEHARRLGEHRRDVLDVLENQVGDDEVELRV